MKLTASDLKEAHVADEVIPEPLGGAQRDYPLVMKNLDEALHRHLKELQSLSPSEHKTDRQMKYRKIG